MATKNGSARRKAKLGGTVSHQDNQGARAASSMVFSYSSLNARTAVTVGGKAAMNKPSGLMASSSNWPRRIA